MIRIKVSVLISNNEVLKRFVNTLSNKYENELEIYAYTDREKAISSLYEHGVNILYAESESNIKPDELPRMCALVYISESKAIDEINGIRSICMFQRPENIFKDLLSVHAENSGDSINTVGDKDNIADVYTFLSPVGGVGSSTIAAAFAIYLTNYQRRVLYVNFEKNGDASAFFSGEGSADMSDMFYDIKSKKQNLALRLESKIKQDNCGVFFIESCRNVLDILCVNQKDVSEFIKTIIDLRMYDDIIIDTDCTMDDLMLETVKLSKNTIVTNDGTDLSNEKIKRFFSAIAALEMEKGESYLSKMFIFYNKYNDEIGTIEDEWTKILIGTMANYYDAQPRQVMQEVLKLGAFDYFYRPNKRF